MSLPWSKTPRRMRMMVDVMAAGVKHEIKV
jgi:hypothetical protein